MLAARAARIVAISNLCVPNSLIFGPSCFLSAPFIFRTPCGVLARISGRACCALWSRWTGHWSCCWSRLASSHK